VELADSGALAGGGGPARITKVGHPARDRADASASDGGGRRWWRSKLASPFTQRHRVAARRAWEIVSSSRPGADFVILAGPPPPARAPESASSTWGSTKGAPRLLRPGGHRLRRERAQGDPRQGHPPKRAGGAGLASSSRSVWVEPELVCEVRFKEWTHGGNLRYAGLRSAARRQRPGSACCRD